jgi:hypothetical protein
MSIPIAVFVIVIMVVVLRSCLNAKEDCVMYQLYAVPMFRKLKTVFNILSLGLCSAETEINETFQMMLV